MSLLLLHACMHMYTVPELRQVKTKLIKTYNLWMRPLATKNTFMHISKFTWPVWLTVTM